MKQHNQNGSLVVVDTIQNAIHNTKFKNETLTYNLNTDSTSGVILESSKQANNY